MKPKHIKYDSDKPMYDLICAPFLAELAELLTIGAKKYSPDNWVHTTELTRYRSALMRHFEAYRMGEEFDPENGIHHLVSVACNAMFLRELERAKNEDNS